MSKECIIECIYLIPLPKIISNKNENSFLILNVKLAELKSKETILTGLDNTTQSIFKSQYLSKSKQSRTLRYNSSNMCFRSSVPIPFY